MDGRDRGPRCVLGTLDAVDQLRCESEAVLLGECERVFGDLTNGSAHDAIVATHAAWRQLSKRLGRCSLPHEFANTRFVDRAIELGIALESLLAPDKQNDSISNTLRIRAARLLGGSIEERQRSAEIVKKAYELRSLAIHAGRLDGKEAPKRWKDPNNVMTALNDGQDLVARALIAVIRGRPDWAEFDLIHQ